MHVQNFRVNSNGKPQGYTITSENYKEYWIDKTFCYSTRYHFSGDDCLGTSFRIVYVVDTYEDWISSTQSNFVVDEPIKKYRYCSRIKGV